MNIYLLKYMSCPMKIWVQKKLHLKKFWSKKMLVQNFLDKTKFLVETKFLVQRNFWSRKVQVQNVVGPNIFRGVGFSFLTLFQASSIFKTCSWQHSIASGTYSGSDRTGSARLTSDNNAISVQLQLQLPTGTELGNKSIGFDTNAFKSDCYYFA